MPKLPQNLILGLYEPAFFLEGTLAELRNSLEIASNSHGLFGLSYSEKRKFLSPRAPKTVCYKRVLEFMWACRGLDLSFEEWCGVPAPKGFYAPGLPVSSPLAFKESLNWALHHRRMNLTQLSKASGINYGLLFYYRAGTVYPTLPTLCSLLNALKLSLEEFDKHADMGHRQNALEMLAVRSKRPSGPPETYEPIMDFAEAVGPEDF